MYISSKAEGVEQSFTKSLFIDMSEENSETVSHTFNVRFPEENLVPGSPRIRVSVMCE